MIGPFFGKFTNLLIRVPHVSLTAVWSCVQQTIIDDAFDQWRKRCIAV